MNIIRGIQKASSRILLYGVQGVGKSTLASKIPDAVFFDTEMGTKRLKVARVPVNDSGAIVAGFDELLGAEKREFRNVIVDTISATETLIRNKMLKQDGKKSIHDYTYGKGWGMFTERFSRFLDKVDDLSSGGYNVVLIGHSALERIHDPEIGDYDRHAPDLDKRVLPLINRRMDAVLFMKYRTFIKPEKDGESRRAVGGTERVICTSHTASHDAKCRFEIAPEVEATFEAIKPIFA